LSIVTALNFLTNATPVVESVFDDRFAKDSMDCALQHSYGYGIDAIPLEIKGILEIKGHIYMAFGGTYCVISQL
jgi:hypothetical protein